MENAFDILEQYKDTSPLEDPHVGAVTDPYSGLVFYELSHQWGPGVPSYPGDPDVIFDHGVKHAQFGVQAFKIRTNFHTGTHMIAPLHMVARGTDLAGVDKNRFFGNGVILDLRHKKNWDKITADDLRDAGSIREGDIVAINTGWHHKYSDSMEYYGEAPGLTLDAAEYLIALKPRFVAIDTPYIDCPCATALTPHLGRPGPFMKRLVPIYEEKTGRNALEDYPGFYPAAKALAAADIPVVVQMSGDVDDITGKRATMLAAPWKIWRGDACPVRFVAIFDPRGKVRIDSGNGKEC